MEPVNPLLEPYGARVEALVAAYDAGDTAAFTAVLDQLVAPRRPELLGDLRELTCNLQVAFERFRVDARLVDLAEKEIPDARQRLEHVLKITEQAAHRTLECVEHSGPPAEHISRGAGQLLEPWAAFRARRIALRDFHDMTKRMDAFLPAARESAEAIRRNLSEVLLAQGYQDLSGQIIRGVMQLVGELETTLAELKRLSGIEPDPTRAAPPAGAAQGPAVPGVDQGNVASGQQDVDALLSGLGM